VPRRQRRPHQGEREGDTGPLPGRDRSGRRACDCGAGRYVVAPETGSLAGVPAGEEGLRRVRERLPLASYPKASIVCERSQAALRASARGVQPVRGRAPARRGGLRPTARTLLWRRPRRRARFRLDAWSPATIIAPVACVGSRVRSHNDGGKAAGRASHALVTPERRNVPCGACFMLGGEDNLHACPSACAPRCRG
jgi:hypothetical protein